MTTTYEDLFLKDQDCFLAEYRDKLATNIRNGLPMESWKNVRDTLLFDFPRLRECYQAHGWEQGIPREQQSEKAKLGRRLAGSMAAIRKDMYDVKPANKPELSQAVAKAIQDGGGQAVVTERGIKMAAYAARMRGYTHVTDEERNRSVDEILYTKNWITQSAVTKTNHKQRADLSNHPMMKELDKLKPGEEIAFFYVRKDLAKEDQSKVAWMSHALGWYKVVPDGRRPYATRVEELDNKNSKIVSAPVAAVWKLTVQRFSTSEPLPVSRKKG